MSQVRVQAWVERDCLRPADVVEALAEAPDRPHRSCCSRASAPSGGPEHLTDVEADAFAALAELGDVRLEQERIPWGTAVAALDAAVRSKDAGSHPIM